MACEVGKKSGECGGLKAKGGTGFNGERITSHVNNAERSILAQLTWPLGARRGPKSVGVRSWWGKPRAPSLGTSGQASFLGSHPIQAPKVLTGGTVILVLHRGRQARPWRVEGCTWLRCPDRPTGDRQHIMPKPSSAVFAEPVLF